jgi:RNA polymerase sigma-70 factor (ECF subfamily)
MVLGGFDLVGIFTRSDAETSIDTACFQAFAQELDYLCRTLRRLGALESEVEDLAHEVFLVLSRNWARYDRTRPLRAYLFGIAFRVTAAHKRRRRREVASETVGEHVDRALRPDERLAAEEERAMVLRALETVPLPRRAVLILHDLDEVPMREIATTLSIPLFTAYSRLRKARQELQTTIESFRKSEKQP